jgi:hypothetical protein
MQHRTPVTQKEPEKFAQKEHLGERRAMGRFLFRADGEMQ